MIVTKPTKLILGRDGMWEDESSFRFSIDFFVDKLVLS